ncbi:hypothetical protein SAMN05660964_02816 [Thiothrix caldifontis]|uniref:Uncharacterized protein n=1 Tax=Thiothrix caldifontis TaxID=525918 RepID=A0A1H4F2U3_9GAMM|nr:DUF6155 family protein [Thiothrix caldifontis]SEA91656.1 hypothetical protein SAMN05660964_02816 [Thiothrix caldifontis]
MTKQTFTLTDLKKHLAQKSKEQLIADIAELYKTFSPVKEFYQAQHADISEIAKKYKDIIIKEFGGTGRGFPKARFSVARNAFNDFKKLTNEPALIADMMLTYVESTSGFCSEYGPDGEEYYTRPENMFTQALQLIQTHKLLEDFRDRAYSIVRNATEGYGHRDSLRDSYDDVYA